MCGDRNEVLALGGLQLLRFLVRNPETTANCFSFTKLDELSSSRWLGVVFFLPYLESWPYPARYERLNPTWLSHSGKREKCQRKWEREKRGRTKGTYWRAGWRVSCKVCVEAAVTDQLALWKHLQSHQSKELHLPQCLCVAARQTDCTFKMQTHVTVTVTVNGHFCAWDKLHWAAPAYIVFMLSLLLLHKDY